MSNRAQIAISNGNIVDANRQIEAALVLYEGEFLAGDVDQPWTLMMREHFRTRVIDRIESFGRELEDTASLSEAIVWYTKGLEINLHAESFYQGLMRCYMRLNQHADAVRTYQRCQRILTSSLAVEPSSDTQELYRKLCH